MEENLLECWNPRWAEKEDRGWEREAAGPETGW